MHYQDPFRDRASLIAATKAFRRQGKQLFPEPEKINRRGQENTKSGLPTEVGEHVRKIPLPDTCYHHDRRCCELAEGASYRDTDKQ